MNWQEWTASELSAVRAAHRWRETVALDGLGPHRRLRGRQVISFASNDYLGLAHHPDVKAAGVAAIEKYGTGSGASRLVAGTTFLHEELEQRLAAWQGAERAVVLPSGFAANLAVLSVFGAADVTICSDELNHASIIDGCRLTRSNLAIYRHADMEHLETLLRENRGRKLVVSDLVFSMDGDVAPLGHLVELCRRYGALLVLDEAHAVLEPIGRYDCDILRVGTLSKSLGALGGWIAGSRAMVDLLVNKARSFIFTTALSPADTAAALQALGIVTSAEGDQLRSRLRERISRFGSAANSPIVPWRVGENSAALEVADRLLDHGFFVPAIRPPSVPVGTSRLRIALSASHSAAMVDQLRAALESCSTTVLNA